MKFEIKGPLKDNIYNSMRKIGYHYQGQDKGELAFARPPRGYPRFHLFLKVKDNNLIFDLHLDQKRPSYKDFTAHSGEHNTEIVKQEAERIKQIIEK